MYIRSFYIVHNFSEKIHVTCVKRQKKKSVNSHVGAPKLSFYMRHKNIFFSKTCVRTYNVRTYLKILSSNIFDILQCVFKQCIHMHPWAELDFQAFAMLFLFLQICRTQSLPLVYDTPLSTNILLALSWHKKFKVWPTLSKRVATFIILN